MQVWSGLVLSPYPKVRQANRQVVKFHCFIWKIILVKIQAYVPSFGNPYDGYNKTPATSVVSYNCVNRLNEDLIAKTLGGEIGSEIQHRSKWCACSRLLYPISASTGCLMTEEFSADEQFLKVWHCSEGVGINSLIMKQMKVASKEKPIVWLRMSLTYFYARVSVSENSCQTSSW